MGDERRLRSLRTIRLEAYGHTNLLEQAERPKGPSIPGYEEITQVSDLEGRRLRQTVTARDGLAASKVTSTTTEGVTTVYRLRAHPTPVWSFPAGDEWLSFSPERVLLTALAVTDLYDERYSVLQDMPHWIVVFSRRAVPVRLFLNTNTSLPTAVETVRVYPYDNFWGVWGDIRTHTYFTFRALEEGGVHYPSQWNSERNGQPYKSFAITDLNIGASLPADSFAVPDSVSKFFKTCKPKTIEERPLERLDKAEREIAPSVVQIPGSWNTAPVRQPDDVVIVEALISSGSSANVIA